MARKFSPLISGTLPHYNKFSPRGGTTIKGLVDHHWAGIWGGDARLMNPHAAVSANYIIYSDGRIFGQVPEYYRAWTSGHAVDYHSITFEIQNETGAPEWRISDKALAALVRIHADIAAYYGWEGVPHWRVRGHRDFASTECPGGYLYPRLGYIADSADAILRGTTRQRTEKPQTTIKSEEEEMKNAGVFYNRQSDGERICLIFNTGSGWYSEHMGADSNYNNALAKAFDTETWAPVSEQQAQNFKNMCERVLATGRI